MLPRYTNGESDNTLETALLTRLKLIMKSEVKGRNKNHMLSRANEINKPTNIKIGKKLGNTLNTFLKQSLEKNKRKPSVNSKNTLIIPPMLIPPYPSRFNAKIIQ